ncbi:hypothetical protein BDV09DRAFT_130678 [Aspergillus tetrazonus]
MDQFCLRVIAHELFSCLMILQIMIIIIIICKPKQKKSLLPAPPHFCHSCVWAIRIRVHPYHTVQTSTITDSRPLVSRLLFTFSRFRLDPLLFSRRAARSLVTSLPSFRPKPPCSVTELRSSLRVDHPPQKGRTSNPKAKTHKILLNPTGRTIQVRLGLALLGIELKP